MLNNLEDGGKNPSEVSRGGNGRGGGGTRSWGTTVSGQSVSTSSSIGSPSSRSEAAMATPASDNTFLRLNNLDIHADDAGSQGTAGNRKKKRAQRATGGDKSGRGLRQFSMKVCEKVESKGRTTYNEFSKSYPRTTFMSDIHGGQDDGSETEMRWFGHVKRRCADAPVKRYELGIVSVGEVEVADELVAEFSDATNSVAGPDQKQYDEKNIRRRVYDALNVLMAMDIISKDKKEIQWKGLPRTDANDIEELKTERLNLRNRIEKKAAYLEELEDQYVGLQNLIKRNDQLYGSGNAPSGGVALPFILVQTRPHATVEVEISEDMQLVHFDFNSTPFELHDDNYILKAMNFCGRPNDSAVPQNVSADGGEGPSSRMANMFQHHIPHPSVPNSSGKLPTSPPLPGILKARVKHEH
ncbi:hypothetical protein H5410_054286 [Solanum commersonii]|uniref:Transcription factor-like protein DPB n=1 Tax=Solanum commersonii TaxID=4109 RepID=A0A9J5X660_SOLCO|nr:hypothetical protein H5410_054286 [Solanum commersonii]